MGRISIILSVIVFLAACAQTETREQKQQTLSNWQGQMIQLSQSLSKLLPLVNSPRKFRDRSNEKVIAEETRRFAKLSHAIQMNKKPEADPSLEFVSRKFSKDMEEAYTQFQQGNKGYARVLIKNTTNYCISCHTRTEKGRTDLNLSQFANVKSMTPLDRAQYFMAVRDFDKALEAFDQAVNSAKAFQQPRKLQVASEKALAVAVRVKRDPDLANELVSRIIDSKTAPVFLKLRARQWKKSIKKWKYVAKSQKATHSGKVKLKRAKAILNAGWKKEADTAHSGAGLVEFLRASTLLHEILSDRANRQSYGEALYNAGLAAEALRDINLWTLHEAYYESCIRYVPYTNLAKRCYLRYESLQLSSYAADEGGYIPETVREHLLELRALAEKSDGNFLDWGFME